MQYHRATSNPRARNKPIYATTEENATPQADVRQRQPASEDDELEAGHRVTSLTRRYTGIPMPDGTLYRQGNQQVYVHRSPPPIRRASRHAPTTTEAAPAPRTRRRFHGVFWVGLVALVMLVGYGLFTLVFSTFGSWWHLRSDDGTYGRPRTFQTDAIVGHSDSQAHPSHFIALNLNRHVIVIELPGGNVSKALIYTGPILLGDGQDVTPVTLTFADVNGDGRPDMALHILDQQIVYLNNGTRFVPPSNLITSGGSHPPTQGDRYMSQERIRTLHIYVSEEEDEAPVIDADPAPQPAPPPPINPLGLAYCSVIGAVFTALPLVAFLLASLLPSSDATLGQTLTLALAVHPGATQGPLASLAPISRSEQSSAVATGLVQEPATKALGLLTFYNGSFTPQTVPAGTRFTGTNGIGVEIAQSVTIPPATPTSPPTDGMVSVVAHSTVFGPAGNLPPLAIHTVCCGGAVLVQNLDALSGGRDARTVPVVTQSDLTTATAHLASRLEQEADDQAHRELAPGWQLLSLACTTRATATHQAGDQASQVQVTVSQRCTPFVYALAAIQQQAMRLIRQRLPHTLMIDHVSLIVLAATVTNPTRGTAALTIHITAFLRAIRPNRSRVCRSTDESHPGARSHIAS